jgi:hypothetical protein
MGNPHSQRMFLVKVSGIEDYFADKSGGDVTSEAVKVYNGGTLVPDVLAGPSEVDNIVVTRPFNRVRDNAKIKQLRSQVGRWRTTVSVTPTDEDLIADADPTVYSDALLIGFTEMEVSASSGDVSTYALSFSVGGVK